jgi:hypothetical protein
MKRQKRLLAFVLAFAFVLVMVPMSAMAAPAPNDITAATIRGVNVFSAFEGSFEDALENPFILELTPAQMAARIAPAVGFEITETGDNDAIILIAPAGTALPAAFANISGTPDWGAALTPTAALTIGATIWISDGPDQVAQIIIALNPEGDLEGDTTVKNPVFNVILPLNIDFALDPMMVGNPDGEDNGNQISGGTYRIINMSGFAVNASFTLTADKAGDLTIVNRGVAPAQTARQKNGFFGVLGALAVANPPTTFASVPTVLGDYEFNPTSPASPGPGRELNDTLVPFNWSANTGTATISFLLAAARDLGSTGNLNNLAASSTGIAAFQFYGELNTLQPWSNTDLEISGRYSLVGVLPVTHSAIRADEDRLAGVNILLPPPPPPNATLTITSTTAGTHSAGVKATVWTESVPLTVLFNIPSRPATIIVANSEAALTTSPWTVTTNYTWDPATGLLTLIRVAVGNSIVVQVNGVNYTINVT